MSEEVNDFLLRVRQLGEKTDREDEERAKQLELDIIEGRKRRQALRAERARSMSPDKGSDRSAASGTGQPPVKDTSLSKKEEIQKTIELLVGPSGTLPLFPSQPSPWSKTETKPADVSSSASESKQEPEKPAALSISKLRATKPSTTSLESKFESLGLDSGKKQPPPVLKQSPAYLRKASGTQSGSPSTPSKKHPEEIPSVLKPNANSPKDPMPGLISPSARVNSSDLSPSASIERRPMYWNHPKSPSLGTTEKQSTPIKSPALGFDHPPQLSPVGERITNPNAVSNRSPALTGASNLRESPAPDKPQRPPVAPRQGTSLSRSPTRSSFIESALRRQGTQRAANGSSTLSGNGSYSPVAERGSGASSPSRSVLPASAGSYNEQKESRSPAPTQSAGAGGALRSYRQTDDDEAPPSLPKRREVVEENRPRLPQRPVEQRPVLPQRPSPTPSPTPSLTPTPIRQVAPQAHRPSSLLSDTISLMNPVAAVNKPLASLSPAVGERVSLSPGPGHPLSASPLSTDNRRLSPSRQTSWLESALKKNQSGSPDQRLARASSVRSPTRSPSPEKAFSPPPGPSPNLSSPSLYNSPSLQHARGRPPVLSPRHPLSTVNESEANREKDDKPRFSEAKSGLTTRTELSPEQNTSAVDDDKREVLKKDSLKRDEFSRPALRSTISSSPSPKAEKPELFRAVTLKKPAPPPLAPKPTAEAVEKLSSLRSTSPTRRALVDREKVAIEEAKAGLKRSNTVQYRAPDAAKELILAAKQSLSPKRSEAALSRVAEAPAPPAPRFAAQRDVMPPPLQRSAHSFTDDLSTALRRGPVPPAPRKASTFDGSPSEKAKTGNLAHPTKRRARGPKRRLPGNLQSQQASASSAPETEEPVPSVSLAVRKFAAPPTASDLNVPKTRDSEVKSKPEIRKSSRVVSGQPPRPPRRSSTSVASVLT